ALAEQGRSMVKSAYGWTVHSAILAARLAQRGFTGPAQIFDGTMGFWEMGAAATPRIAHLTDRLGETYLLEEVQFKPYPACRFLHPVLDGIRNLLAIGVRGEAVRGVEVRGFSLLQDEYHNISRPRSPTDAQFSVPYTVAVMLLDGRLGPDAFTPERLTDSRTLALADRVRVTVDPDFEAAYPQQLGAAVTITVTDGRSLEARVDRPRGDPGRPLTEEELREKFHLLSEPALGRDRTMALGALIDALPELDSVRSLTALLRTPAPG
ncbi:MAG: hypothetical protein RB148_04475, partial [Armatimonadota bacterium]|nr:hypothetical protein [Armatimonadota bacterium]